MDGSLVILVTGSSRGIGAELARRFAQSGNSVVVNYSRSKVEAEELVKSIREESGDENVVALQADVSKRADVERLFQEAIARFGRVDVLITNAGINIDVPFLEMNDDQWQRVIDTNLTGCFLCSQVYARNYAGTHGVVIHIGASTGFRGRKNGANYCASKAGVINLTKCMELELAPKIRVNCIIPGYIDTQELVQRYHFEDPANKQQIVNTIPLSRLGSTDDIYQIARFLVKEADYITGQNFFVNGGNYMG